MLATQNRICHMVDNQLHLPEAGRMEKTNTTIKKQRVPIISNYQAQIHLQTQIPNQQTLTINGKKRKKGNQETATRFLELHSLPAKEGNDAFGFH